MSSTFSGVGTALSSLIAQRQALDVSAQNLANANTVGYTRQRASLSSLAGTQTASLFSTADGVGVGVQVTSVDRLADAFVDARLRTATASSSYLTSRADSYSQLETSLAEPGTNALSTQLTDFWSAWQEAANYSDAVANRSVLLTKAQTVVDKLHTLSTSFSTQWEDTRSAAAAAVDQVNSVAASIADLNQRILGLTSNGQPASELRDHRDQLITSLSQMVGATTSTHSDGQVDVLVAGNQLVNGGRVSQLELTGATNYNQALAGTAVTLQWADHPGVPVSLDGGTVGGQLSAIAPPAAGGTGGILTEAGTQLNAVALEMITGVNALHTSAVTVAGVNGGAFFSGTGADDVAVAIADPNDVALASSTLGGYDGSVGLTISRLGQSATGPNSLWQQTVVQIGSRTSASVSRATVAEDSRQAISAQQLASTSVDADEETVNMLAYQRAYQAAARVLTTIDEVLDTLINRMAV